MKIAFKLLDGTIENMHAEILPDGTFRLENSPFYFYGISFGDRFEAIMEDSRLFFSRVIERSGHSTYRIKLASSIKDSEFQKTWQPLAALGCTYEESRASGQRLYAIDIPPGTDVHAIYRLLESGEEAGYWTFEEGHYVGD